MIENESKNSINVKGNSNIVIADNDICGDLNVTIHQHKSMISTIIEGFAEHCQKIFKKQGLSEEEVVFSNVKFIRTDLKIKNKIERDFKVAFFDSQGVSLFNNILGPPKIGKTTLLMQSLNKLDKESYFIKWFDANIAEDENSEFYTIFENTLKHDLVKQLKLKPKTNLSDLFVAISNQNISSLPKKIIYVIDNIDGISKDTKNLINKILEIIRNSSLTNCISINFISNKKQKLDIHKISNEILTPKWTANELKELIELNNIELKETNLNFYYDNLQALSSGHPLKAIVIAKQSPTTAEMLSNMIYQKCSFTDSDLSAELKKLLFENLLTTNEEKNVLIKLSCLIRNWDKGVFDLIAKQEKCNPKILFEKLEDIFIEGNDEIGYKIPLVFQEIAKQYIMDEDRKKLYKDVSEFCYKLTDDKTLNGNRVLDGINYSILIGEIEIALTWGILILYNLKDIPNETMEYICDDLKMWFSILREPADITPKYLFWFFGFSIAQKYMQIKCHKKSNDILLKLIEIDYNELLSITDDVLSKYIHFLRPAVETCTVINFYALKQFDELLKFVPNLKTVDSDILDLPTDTPQKNKMPNVFFTMDSCLEACKDVKSLQVNHLYSCIELVDLNNRNLLEDIIGLFRKIGYIYYTHSPKSDIGKFLSISKSSFVWNFLVDFSKIEYLFKQNDYSTAMNLIDKRLSEIEKLSFNTELIQAHLLELKGDIYKFSNETDKAYDFYSQSIQSFSENPLSFHYAFSSLEAGRCCRDDSKALIHLQEAIEYFKIEPAYKNFEINCMGEMSITKYILGDEKYFADTASAFLEKFYIENDKNYQNAAIVFGAMIFRHIHNKEGKTIPDEQKNSFPDFKRGLFQLDGGKKCYPVNSTPFLIFYFVAKMYHLFDNIEKELYYANLALKYLNPSQPDEKNSIGITELINFSLKHNYIDDIKRYFITILNYLGELEVTKNTVKYLIIDLNLKDLNEGKITHFDFDSYINELEFLFLNYSLPNKDYWLAEIYQLKSGIGIDSKQDSIDVKFSKLAHEHALIAKSYIVLLNVSSRLGFTHLHLIGSVNTIAKYELDTLLALSCGEETENKYIIAGENIYNCWINSEYSRIIPSEYKVWINIKYRANLLKKYKVPNDLIAPIMLLTLLAHFRVVNDKEYEKIKRWSEDKLFELKQFLPRKIIDFIYLQININETVFI